MLVLVMKWFSIGSHRSMLLQQWSNMTLVLVVADSMGRCSIDYLGLICLALTALVLARLLGLTCITMEVLSTLSRHGMNLVPANIIIKLLLLQGREDMRLLQARVAG